MEQFRQPTIEEIAADWGEFTGGPPVLAALGTFEPGEVEGLLYEGDNGQRVLLTWWQDGEKAELVSAHASPPGSGAGTIALERMEADLRARGVRRLIVATTNDNLAAVAFYQRRGFRLVRVELDQLDRVRERKPHVPKSGHDGLPLQDLWVFEKRFE